MQFLQTFGSLWLPWVSLLHTFLARLLAKQADFSNTSGSVLDSAAAVEPKGGFGFVVSHPHTHLQTS